GTAPGQSARAAGRSRSRGHPCPLLMLVDYRRLAADLPGPPLVGEDGPEHLVVILAVAQERVPQRPLAQGAELAQRRVAAAVPDRRARFEPMRAERVEREANRQLRAVAEEPGAPELRREREAPLR